MYQFICLDPKIFDEDNKVEFVSLFKDIINNGILLFDEDDKLDEEYKRIISNLDPESKKFFEAYYTYLTNNLTTSRQRVIGKVDINNFENSILKRIKSSKIIRSYVNENFKNINKEYFIFVISTNKNKESQHLLKQKFAFPIEEYSFSQINRKFEEMNNGVLLKGKNIDDVVFNYIIPILWFSEEICFFAKEISTGNQRWRKENRKKFQILFNKIIDILKNIKKIDKPKIKIVTGSNDIEIINECEEFKNMLRINNEDFIFQLILHKDKSKINDLHPRSIYADGLCINFEKSPEFTEEKENFSETYNRILIDKVYGDYVKNENLTKNI